MKPTRLLLLFVLAAAGCGTMKSSEGGEDRNHPMAKVGQDVELRGMARDAKAGAVVITADGPVYVEGLAHWPSGLSGKAVVVNGVLRQKKRIPDPGSEPVGAGAEGLQLVVENPRWKGL